MDKRDKILLSEIKAIVAPIHDDVKNIYDILKRNNIK
mgnify:FL=1